MIDHITIAVADLPRSQTFYDKTLSAIGIERMMGDGKHFAGYGEKGRAFFFISTKDGSPTATHVAFECSSRQLVEKFHEAAIANGAYDNGQPGVRPEYGERYYGAFVYDLEGVSSAV